MAWHHDPDAGVSDPCLALLDEMDMLVRSIVGFPTGEGGDHATILEAFGEFLMRFGSDQIPWVRLYEIFPAWQQRSRLLQQDWDEVAVQGANLVLTLVNPLPGGAFFSRKARGGGTWKSTGGDTIGKKVVLSKLYCRRGGYRNGFTAFEFRLSTDVQPRPRVALCVLHRTDYRHCARDLRQYAHQGWFPGRIQANPQDVPQIYQDPYVAGAGIITGPLVDYANNRASNSGNSYGQPSIHSSWEVPPPCASLHEQLLNLLLLSANNSMTEISRYNRLGGMQANIPSSTYSVNDSMRYMPCETNMLAGQHSHVDEMSTQNYDYNNSTGNINHYANPPIQDAMTNYNEPLLEPLPLWEGNPTATTDDHAQDGHQMERGRNTET